MKGLNYPELAGRYEFEGHWDWGRRLTRSGLRRFLIAVARERRGRNPREYTLAEVIYADSIFAYRTALHDLGIRLPARLAAADKAKVRSLLVREPFAVRNSKVGRWAGLR